MQGSAELHGCSRRPVAACCPLPLLGCRCSPCPAVLAGPAGQLLTGYAVCPSQPAPLPVHGMDRVTPHRVITSDGS